MRKFKCVGYNQNHEKNFTVGKIYYGEDGSGIKCDNGFIYDCYKSIDEVINFLSEYYEFEEVFDEEVKEDKKVGKYDLKKDKIAVLCDTDKKLTELYKLFNSKPNTSVALVCNPSKLYVSWDRSNDELTWDSIDYHKLNHYTLITFEEFINGIVFENPKTFTITTSATTTTLTDGTHTTSINRYYTDKHDDMIALEEVVKKYKSEIEEIERVDKMPKVGDKVKVIDDRYCYTTYYQWFFENKITDECAMKWRYNFYPKNSERVFRVVEIGKHNRYDVVIALITDDYNTYLINIEGLEVIK